MKPLADNLDLDANTNAAWTTKFQNALQNDLNSGANINQSMIYARSVADQGRFIPGTAAFNTQRDIINGVNNWDHSSVYPQSGTSTGGAALWQKSRMYNADGQYDLSKKVKFVDLLVGADFRTYQILPDGNNFVDFSRAPADRATPGGNSVYYTKFSGFAQATKRLFDDKLKLVASLRYDKNLSFKGVFNPRLAVVYTVAKAHNFRASWQNGYRFPSLFEALSYVNNGGVRRIGGLSEINNGLNYLNNSYTYTSVTNFNNAVTADVNNGFSKTQAAIKEQGKLQIANLTNERPERINSYEIGYKSLLFNNKLIVDWDAYTNTYTGFLGQVDVAVPNGNNVNNTSQASLDVLSKNITRYRVYTNSNMAYNNYGTGLGLYL